MRRRASKTGFVAAYCLDCGQDTAPPDKRGRVFTWEVHDYIWREAGMKPNEHLCWYCLERRLGRKITPLDLKWISRW
jgi:hypothetical protein